MWNKKIQRLAQENNGELPSIIFPHAVAYFDNDGSILCWECANESKEESIWTVVDYGFESTDIHDLYSDVITICDSCGLTIDPAIRGE